jgi:Uma2 family endonuclease
MRNLAVTLKNAMAGLPEGASIHLPNVRWDTYTSIVKELDGEGRVRLAYDRGDLYLMTKSRRHEIISRLFFPLIEVLVEARGGDFLSIGEATLNSQLAERGIEADECFYFHHIAEQNQEKDYDLAIDPPPDLAIEVDITSGSIPKFPIYAAIGVPELWRHDGKQVQFYRLEDEDYYEIDASDLFPFLTPDVVLEFLEEGEAEGTIAMVKKFRKWVRANKM